MGVPRNGFDRALKSLYDYLDNKPKGVNKNGTLEAVTGLTVSEDGVGPLRKVVLTLKNVTVALTDEEGVVAYLGKKLYTFPEGMLLFVGANASLAVTKSSAGVNDDFDSIFGLGTATASNNATLTSTEQDMLPSLAVTQAVSGAAALKSVSTSNEAVKILDGTSAAKAAFLNFLISDADHNVAGTACNMIFNGTIELLYVNLGDK